MRIILADKINLIYKGKLFIMDVIKTTKGIGNTIRNVTRLKEVISVLSKNGFDEFLGRSNIATKIPGFVIPKSKLSSLKEESEGKNFWESVGHRLKISFETLGPGFIKLGQLIASREDFFDQDFLKELKKLQDDVKPLDFSEYRTVFENDIGKKIEEIFSKFEEAPLATASIGSVFRAVTHDGKAVVVKIQKPNIKKIIDTDFNLFKFVITSLESISDEFKYLGISRVIDDFHSSVFLELNYLLEKKNLLVMKDLISSKENSEIIKIPDVYSELCGNKVLAMEELSGIPFNKLTSKDLTNGLSDNLITSTKLFIKTLLEDGYFHADLHGGNFFLLKEDKLGILDFGSIGHLSKKNRSHLIAILYSLSTNNFENLVYEFLCIADYDQLPDERDLARQLKFSLTPYLGLSSKEIDVSELTNSLVSTLKNFKIYLPKEWYLIFKSITSLDGVGRSIGVDLDVFNLLESDTSEVAQMLISKDQLIEDGLWFSRDLLNSIRILPRHFSWYLSKLSKDNYAFRVKSSGLEDSLSAVANSLLFLSLIVLASVFFIGGIITLDDLHIEEFSEIPLLTKVFWLFSLIIFSFSITKMPKRKK